MFINHVVSTPIHEKYSWKVPISTLKYYVVW
jgi:hypothetical protein